jgi:hypothetical protein
MIFYPLPRVIIYGKEKEVNVEIKEKVAHHFRQPVSFHPASHHFHFAHYQIHDRKI